MPKKRANGEGSIRKRKDGRWEGRYTAGCDPVTGKPIHKSVLAKTQSERKLWRSDYPLPPAQWTTTRFFNGCAATGADGFEESRQAAAPVL